MWPVIALVACLEGVFSGGGVVGGFGVRQQRDE